MREREILTIAVTPEGKIVALCDDSSIWIKDNEWKRVTDLPGTIEIPEFEEPA